MRYLLVIVALGVVLALVVCVSAQAVAQEEPGPGDQAKPEEGEPEEDGADEDELDMLKRAWKRHKEEKEEENPSGRASEQQDPLEAIAGKMKAVERRLVKEDPGTKTQDKQREVLDLLDDLIKKAEEAQQQSSSSQKPKPGQKQQPGQKPGQQQKKMTDPSRSNPAQPNSQRQKQILQKVGKEDKAIPWRAKGGSAANRWGHLPGHVDKEDVESGSREEFPEKYRKLLEGYYRQLTKPRPGSGR